MPNTKSGATKSKEVAVKEPTPSKGFTVLDGNGKLFRVTKTEDEAKVLAQELGGRVVR